MIEIKYVQTIEGLVAHIGNNTDLIIDGHVARTIVKIPNGFVTMYQDGSVSDPIGYGHPNNIQSVDIIELDITHVENEKLNDQLMTYVLGSGHQEIGDLFNTLTPKDLTQNALIHINHVFYAVNFAFFSPTCFLIKPTSTTEYRALVPNGVEYVTHDGRQLLINGTVEEAEFLMNDHIKGMVKLVTFDPTGDRLAAQIIQHDLIKRDYLITDPVMTLTDLFQSLIEQSHNKGPAVDMITIYANGNYALVKPEFFTDDPDTAALLLLHR